MMDIDRLRDKQIQLHQLSRVDTKYTFYHDETNNVRKLHIEAHGLNVAELNVFVLGGVVHEGEPRPLDIWPLRDALRIQKTAHEIKLEHVAKGTFLDLLRSTKLIAFLRWIADNGLMIHYHELDPLYWSTVDIIDSILSRIDNPMLVHYHALLKSDLTAVLRSDLAATIGLFHRYSYPGLAPESRKPFLDGLLELLEHNSATLPEFNATMLKGMIQAGRGIDSLAFIEGNPPNLLIDNFSIFYVNRIAIFKYSNHILDMEKSIQDHFTKTPITSGGVPVTHYRFADSKAETGIQLADIIVGVLGKMHTYLTETPWEKVAEVRAALTGASLENAELLRDLISASHDANVAFLHHVASVHDLDKLDLFLRFHDGRYAA
jgi:Protein of unknown function (DUF3800)